MAFSVARVALACALAAVLLATVTQAGPGTKTTMTANGGKVTVNVKGPPVAGGGGGGAGAGGSKGKAAGAAGGAGGAGGGMGATPGDAKKLKKQVLKELKKKAKATDKFKDSVIRAVMKRMKKRGGRRGGAKGRGRGRGGRGGRGGRRRGGRRGGKGGPDFVFLPQKRGLYLIPDNAIVPEGELGIPDQLGVPDNKPCEVNCEAKTDKVKTIAGQMVPTAALGSLDDPGLRPVRGTQTTASPPVTKILAWRHQPENADEQLWADSNDPAGHELHKRMRKRLHLPSGGRAARRRRRHRGRGGARKLKKLEKKLEKRLKKTAKKSKGRKGKKSQKGGKAKKSKKATPIGKNVVNIDTEIKAAGKTHKFHKTHRFRGAKPGRKGGRKGRKGGRKGRKGGKADDCACEEEADDCECDKKKPRPFIMDMVQPATKMIITPVASSAAVVGVAPAIAAVSAVPRAADQLLIAPEQQIVNCGCLVCPCPESSPVAPIVDAQGRAVHAAQILPPSVRLAEKFHEDDAVVFDKPVVSNTAIVCGCEVCPCPAIHEIPSSCGCSACPCPVSECGCLTCPCAPGAVPFPHLLTPVAQLVAENAATAISKNAAALLDCGCQTCPCNLGNTLDESLALDDCSDPSCPRYVSPEERERRAKEIAEFKERQRLDARRKKLHEEMVKHQSNFNAIARMSRALRFQYAELQRQHMTLKARVKVNEHMLTLVNAPSTDTKVSLVRKPDDPKKRLDKLQALEDTSLDVAQLQQKIALCNFLKESSKCDVDKLEKLLDAAVKKHVKQHAAAGKPAAKHEVHITNTATMKTKVVKV